jgi:hypothetical protein
MLISQSLIFVHNPRTGGMSVRDYLKRAAPGHYFPESDPKLGDQQKAALMHQGLAACYQYATRLGFDPLRIPTLVCIRNPYSLTLSGYLYLAQRWREQVQEIEGTFAEYLQNLVTRTPAKVLEQRAAAHYGPFSSFLTLGGDIVPDNLTIARTESLREDIAAFLKDKVGVSPPPGFPHKNASQHEHFSKYYGKAEEEIVYRMYKSAFDNGLYQRYEGLEL